MIRSMTGFGAAELGTNGRSCFTCHRIDQGWTITPAGVQARFTASSGNDPIFRLVDGANSPRADVSTLAARRAAYSMVLARGVIRVGLAVPAGRGRHPPGRPNRSSPRSRRRRVVPALPGTRRPPGAVPCLLR